MKKIFLVVSVGLAAILGGCSTAQREAFQGGLSNFTASVESVNAAIAQVSASLAQNCNTLQATAGNLSGLVTMFTTNTKAIGGLSAANAALRTWCQSPPTDIQSAITATAAEIAAAKAAYKAAQKG